MDVLSRPERLLLIYAVLTKVEPVASEEAVHKLFEIAFDEVEDAHSGVRKDPLALSLIHICV